jgi:hypothetical protein
MSKVLVLYYSAYGHIENMAEAIAEGARAVPDTEVTIKRVPELVPEEIAKKSGMKLEQPAPIATVAELPNYDAIIFGTPTRSDALGMSASLRSRPKLGTASQRRAVPRTTVRRLAKCEQYPSTHLYGGCSISQGCRWTVPKS